MIELQGVVKRYGDHVAVDHVNLSCAAGQTHVLIGPSGCGKSTLLRMMVGLVTPDAGEVRVAGEALTAATIPQLRRRIGYMIQEGGLFPHLSAFDNVSLLPRYLRWSAKKIAERIDELRELTHLPPTLLQRFPRQLSGGQRQRVSLMRALMLDPDVLLLDEPLGDLDPMIRAELQQDLKDVFAELHKTVVLVTHDLAEAHFLGHRITLLQAGRIIQQGALAELIHHPADEFVSRFVRAQRQLAS
jgi:osmoprotectant transport system ATP-binding protein